MPCSSADVEDEAAAHRARGGVFVLGVEGYEQLQARAYGLRHVPGRPDPAQALAQEQRAREAARGDQRLRVRLGLGGAEIAEHPARGGLEHGGVFREHAAARLAALVPAQPGRGADEVLHYLRHARRVAAPGQGEEFRHAGHGLPRAERLLPPRAEELYYSAVIVPGEAARRPGVVPGGVPGRFEQPGRLVLPGGGGFGPAALEFGRRLGGEHVGLGPHAHLALRVGAVDQLRLRQQGFYELGRPPAPFKGRYRPVLLLAAPLQGASSFP